MPEGVGMTKRIAKDGYEQDAYYARRFYHWKAGIVKQIKRRTHKRERQEGKVELRIIEKELK
jgi:hypothetical protein